MRIFNGLLTVNKLKQRTGQYGEFQNINPVGLCYIKDRRYVGNLSKAMPAAQRACHFANGVGPVVKPVESSRLKVQCDALYS